MVFRILDASAFYAGMPFSTTDEFFTTSLIFDEIKHIKKNHDAIGTLMETKRLKISDPDAEFVDKIKVASKKTGDFNQLSKQDISVIALCLQMNGEIITDDFAISNVAKNLNLKVSSLMTSGINDVGNWIHYCLGCKKNFESGSECPLCGTRLKRKLIKHNA
ncbi:MAG: nucleotide binding protein [Marine Group I thaumarchaeote]|nr:MAG: nucleotide binding protein [Marine Group I thaumarchaeote]